MLLLSSGNSGLKEPSNNMVLSQVHAWAEKMEREQERENNNNTVKRDLLRTPPPRCKNFIQNVFLNLIQPTINTMLSTVLSICFYNIIEPSVVIKYNSIIHK